MAVGSMGGGGGWGKKDRGLDFEPLSDFLYLRESTCVHNHISQSPGPRP